MAGNLNPREQDKKGGTPGSDIKLNPADTDTIDLSDLGLMTETERLRQLPELDATAHLSPEQEVQRNLSFVDSRHHDLARQFVADTLYIHDPAEQPKHLHKYYLQEYSKKDGRFETAAWENFNKAANYVDGLIEGNPGPHRTFSGLPDIEVILTINSFVQKGDAERILTLIRGSSDVMGVFRDKDDVLASFDREGLYRSKLFVPPPLLGFCSREQFITQHRGESIIGLLRTLSEERPTGTERERIFRELGERTAKEPHGVAEVLDRSFRARLQHAYGNDTAKIDRALRDPGKFADYKGIQIISAMSRPVLGTHLNTVCDQFESFASQLVKRFGSEQALKDPVSQEKFQKAAIRLGTHFGSVIDMGHFAQDGMGRTNLQLERLVMGLFGLERNGPVAVTQNGKQYENGTYVFPKDVRVEAIFATLPPLDVEKAVSSMATLSESLTAKKGRRLEFKTGA